MKYWFSVQLAQLSLLALRYFCLHVPFSNHSLHELIEKKKKRLLIVINSLFLVPLVRTHSVSQPRTITIIQPLKDYVKNVCLTNGILKQFKLILNFAKFAITIIFFSK